MSKQLTPIQILSEMDRQARIKKSPSMPPNYIIGTKYSDKTANGLTKAIIAYLNLSGHFAERINNMGRMIDKTKVVKDVLGMSRTIGKVEWQKGSGTKGTADISSVIKGRFVSWEVKIGKDRQSKDQKIYENRVTSSGGYYFTVKSFDDFYTKYNNLIDTI